MDDNEQYTMDRLFARLVKLETKVCLKFEAMEKAENLARNQLETSRIEAKSQIEKERIEAKNVIDHRLAGMNEYQHRIDKIEGTLATKTDLARVEKFVWIGIGIVIALEFVLRFFVRV
jgi:hypothetical protein